jgi:hypothetical protein
MESILLCLLLNKPHLSSITQVYLNQLNCPHMYATCEGSWFKYTCVTLDLTNVVSWSTVTNQEPVALDMPQW